MNTTYFSNALLRARVSATELAAKAGVPRPTVYAHLKGARSIGQAHAKAYAAALGVTLEEVLGPPVGRECLENNTTSRA